MTREQKRNKIACAADVLTDLLNFNGQGECPVSKDEAQALWDDVGREGGFGAVKAFLSICGNLHDKEAK